MTKWSIFTFWAFPVSSTRLVIGWESEDDILLRWPIGVNCQTRFAIFVLNEHVGFHVLLGLCRVVALIKQAGFQSHKLRCVFYVIVEIEESRHATAWKSILASSYTRSKNIKIGFMSSWYMYKCTNTNIPETRRQFRRPHETCKYVIYSMTSSSLLPVEGVLCKSICIYYCHVLFLKNQN